MMANFLDGRLSGRFWSKCFPEPNCGCWLWTGCLSDVGYGQIRIDYKVRGAHVVAYLALVGSYDPTLDLDHLCRTRCCVNPAHLEPVTRAVNLARGLGTGMKEKTHCPAGHPYDAANTYVYRGRRSCRACHIEVTRRAPRSGRRTRAG